MRNQHEHTHGARAGALPGEAAAVAVLPRFFVLDHFQDTFTVAFAFA
jgi:hypothetical protein